MLDGLATGAFLDRARARGWLAIAAAATVAMVGFGLATSHGLFDLTGRPLGTDFISFWTAARLAIAGEPAAVWDMARHGAEQVAVFGPSSTHAAFFYPPVFLLVCLPFGALPYLPALAAWLMVTGFVCRQALVAWAGPWSRGLLGGLAFVGFPAVFATLGHGQNSFLTTAIFAAGGVLAARGRPIAAGLVLGCLVYKPHMAVVLPIAFLAGGGWRSVAAMAASAAGWIAVSILAFGWSAWQAFFDLAAAVRTTLAAGLVDPGKMISVDRALVLLGVDGTVAGVAHGAVAVAVVVALVVVCRRNRAPEAAVAAGAAATLLISPFLLDYDLMLAAVPMAWLVRRGLADGFARWEKLAIMAAFVLPGVARPLALGLGLPLAPLVTGLFYAVVLRRVVADAAPGRVAG